MDIDIGIDARSREQIASRLSHVLADTYGLYLETHNYHWNVTGPMFQTLHLMFEQQYSELAEAVDLVAERIRALGFPAPATYRQFMELSSLTQDDRTDVPSAAEMIRSLVQGHETVVRTSRDAFRVADDADDQPTCDLLTERMKAHEKTAWMLRSLLEPAQQRPGAAARAAAKTVKAVKAARTSIPRRPPRRIERRAAR